MDYEVLSSRQVAETGRLDAAYNILYHRHKAELSELLSSVTREEMVALASSMPVEPHAARVVSGSRKAVGAWTDDELGLYIIQVRDELSATADRALESASERKELVGKIAGRGHGER